LSDTLARYLPAFSARFRHQRSRTLLAHASGVANPDYKALFGHVMSLDEIVAEIGRKPLNFLPGTGSRYSNAGYNLLAAMIERVSGQSYGTALPRPCPRSRRMTATGDASDDAVVPNLATPYVAGPGPRARAWRRDHTRSTSAVGRCIRRSTTCSGGVAAIQTNRLFALGTIPYAYGWGERRLAGGRWLEQNGAVGTAGSRICMSGATARSSWSYWATFHVVAPTLIGRPVDERRE